MSILFDAGSSQYLEVALALAEPFSMGCWAYSADLTNAQSVMSLGDADGADYHSVRLKGNTAGDPIWVATWDGAGIGAAETSSGYSANTWHQILGVFAATDDRRAYIDGGSKGTNALNRIVADADHVTIGTTASSVPALYLSGRVAEGAIWDAALDDADALLLAAGVPPYMVKPANLVAYWPMHVAGMLDDLIGSYDLTAVNGPTTAEHPPVLTLGGPIYVEYEVAAPPVGNPWYAYAQMQ